MATAKMSGKRGLDGACLLALTRWRRALSRHGLEWSFLLLLVWTPLAFGSVHPLSTALMQGHIFLLLAIWIGCRSPLLGKRAKPHPVAIGRRAAAWGFACIALFIALLMFQALPLAPQTLQWLSPSTSRLYSQFLPHWPDARAPLSLHVTATRAGVVACIAHAGLFCFVVDAIRTRHQWRRVTRVIVAVACLMAVLAMAQQFSGTTSIYWLRDTSYAPDFFGPYINRNHCAAYLVMALLLGLGLLYSDAPHRPKPGSGVAPRLMQFAEYWIGARGLWAYALALIAAALCLSLSRGALLSLLAGLTLWALLRRSSTPGPGAWLSWAGALAMLTAAGLWVGVDPLLDRLTAEQIGSEFSSGGRLGLWRATWDMAKAFPWWGIGFAAYPVVFSRYQTADLNGHFLQAHNDLLHLLAEVGWVGVALVVGVLACLGSDIVNCWRRRRDPFVRHMIPAGLSALAAMALHALVDFNFHIPANALLFTVVLALLYAGVRLPRRRHRSAPEAIYAQAIHAQERAEARRGRVALTACGVAVALWLCGGAARVAIANLWYPQQRFVRPTHWTQHASLERRRERLLRAVRWQPRQEAYWLGLADLDVAWAQRLPSPEDAASLVAMTARLHAAEGKRQRALQQRPTDVDAHLGRLLAWRWRASAKREGAPALDDDLTAYAAKVATLAPANATVQYAIGAVLLAHEIDVAAAPALSRGGLTSLRFFQQAMRLRSDVTTKLWSHLLAVFPEAEALARFTMALPQTAEALLTAARLIEKHSWPHARYLYLSGLALASSTTQAMQRYGDALYRHGAYAAARAVWTELQAVSPNNAEVYRRLADTQSRLGDFDGAVLTLQQLARRFPERPERRHQLATAYLRAGRVADAQAEWRALSSRFPYFVDAYVGLAQAYEAQGDYSGSIAMMRKAVNLQPGSISSYGHLARLYGKLGAPDAALREYQRLELFHPDNPEVLYQIGEYARQAREPRRAFEYFNRALRLDPDAANVRRALERLERQHGSRLEPWR